MVSRTAWQSNHTHSLGDMNTVCITPGIRVREIYTSKNLVAKPYGIQFASCNVFNINLEEDQETGPVIIIRLCGIHTVVSSRIYNENFVIIRRHSHWSIGLIVEQIDHKSNNMYSLKLLDRLIFRYFNNSLVGKKNVEQKKEEQSEISSLELVQNQFRI